MKISIFALVLILGSFGLQAQNLNDTLTFNRKIFNSAVYLDGGWKPNKDLKKIYIKNNAFSSERLLRKHRVMLPFGAATAALGLGLGIDALVGTKKSAVINNVEHTYYERPIFQLLGGLALIAGGICVIEFGNDAKVKSVKEYNAKRKKDAANMKVGLLETGKVGLSIRVK